MKENDSHNESQLEDNYESKACEACEACEARVYRSVKQQMLHFVLRVLSPLSLPTAVGGGPALGPADGSLHSVSRSGRVCRRRRPASSRTRWCAQ